MPTPCPAIAKRLGSRHLFPAQPLSKGNYYSLLVDCGDCVDGLR